MDAKQELMMRLRQIVSDNLGVDQDEISEQSTWSQLGADSLDRLGISRAIEETFKVEIPHTVGERLNTVGETSDHLWNLVTTSRTPDIRIEAATTDQQWAEMEFVRNQVFTAEHGFMFQPLPGPRERGVWHFLARDHHRPIGALSILDTTDDVQLHHRCGLNFEENERIARYGQLAILKPYRKRGISNALIEAAQRTVIRSNGFTSGWLLYPAAHAHSSILTRLLGFTPGARLLKTEFGDCYTLVRRESAVHHARPSEALPFAAAAG